MDFRNERRGKTWLLKCIKSPVSEHPSPVNMLKSAKHCWEFYDSTFMRLFDNSSSNINEVIVVVLNSLLFFYENIWKLITSRARNMKKLRWAHYVGVSRYICTYICILSEPSTFILHCNDFSLFSIFYFLFFVGIKNIKTSESE